MLVLSRKIGQAICVEFVGPDGSTLLRITPVEMRAGKVRLTFEAPAEVKILREELVSKLDQPEPVPA